jgi:hypothetical protein
MNVQAILKQIDASTARAFVQATRHVIDAMLIEGERIAQAQRPTPRDYNSAAIDATTPAGGWISDSEIHDSARRLSEAIAAEKWIDGAMFAIRLLSRMA